MLKFESNSSGGGGGESLAQTLVIGNTTGGTDINITDVDNINVLNASSSIIFPVDSSGTQSSITTGTYGMVVKADTNTVLQFDNNLGQIITPNTVLVKGGVVVGYGAAQNGTVQFQNGKDTTTVIITSNDAAVLNLDNATHDVKVGINNNNPAVALDVVGSVKISNLLSINGLTDFASNAAAITGGLVAGDLYYTNVAGQATLKIVI